MEEEGEEQLAEEGEEQLAEEGGEEEAVEMEEREEDPAQAVCKQSGCKFFLTKQNLDFYFRKDTN